MKPLPEEFSPSRFIEKIRLPDREVMDDPIDPDQLLIQAHRDYHWVDIHARFMMSRVVRKTGSEKEAYRQLGQMRGIGHRISRVIAGALGRKDPEQISKALFGLKEKHYFFRFKRHERTAEQIDGAIEQLKKQARERMDRQTQVCVLLTGGTGFVGKEILWQAARDPRIEEVYVVIRPKTVWDRKTKEVIEVLSPERRGADLLKELWIDEPGVREKFHFLGGDVEAPNLGIDDANLERLRPRLTHVIHCAASVAFDDPYEASFKANVQGTLNALRFSHGLQEHPDSPFVAHLGIETSYIHGRQVGTLAREDEIVFPRSFYNNFYELTKAMASIETERFMLSKGLRVIQLCPAIVIGDSISGNNRGDTKVVNAPVNLFGRAQEAVADASKGRWIQRSKANMLARLACVFPGDPTAELNLIPVDRVAAGIVAALKRAEAVGERIHLATDNRITSRQIRDVVQEELGVKVKLAEPTLHRTVGLPLLSKVLRRVKQEKFARILERLGNVFGGYSEWGQPVHEVGNDVRLLGLPEERPRTVHVFRMLCRHNRFVQRFGRIPSGEELSRRERVWQEFLEELQRETGREPGSLTAAEFAEALGAHPEVRQALAERAG